ncbi:MAG TPA: alpha/beta hydrolase [Blastocatellia bacterium]|nr:alpha/beta hydrolase [Blastocatellia bacterium]
MQRRIIFSIVLSIAVISGAAFAQDKPEEAYFKTSDGVKIHYYVLGKGTPVILIHGYTGTAYGNWFENGIAQALAKNHMVVALDCRNHGKSDKPEPHGAGRAEDVIEMMDHLKIGKAHFHGYSMGGGIVARLLALVPDRFITASFGGSGIPEVDPEWRAKTPKDKEGRDPQEEIASRALRERRAAVLGITVEELVKQQEQRRAALQAAASARQQPAGPRLDLTKLDIPMLAINGEYDRPNARTARLAREAKNFKNVILPGKSHLTAIMAGFMPKEYLDNLVAFINANDPKK